MEASIAAGDGRSYTTHLTSTTLHHSTETPDMIWPSLSDSRYIRAVEMLWIKTIDWIRSDEAAYSIPVPISLSARIVLRFQAKIVIQLDRSWL